MITTEGSNELREMRDLAQLVIEHHFGSKSRRIVHKTSGLSNFVFAVKHAEGEFIVRISPDATRLNSFIKEQWTQNKAREAGVPTPEILEVGNDVIGHPFMISRVVAGGEATHHPERQKILREMGRIAALVNSIKTTGFGATFDWSSNQLSLNETFKDFLEKELRLDEKLKILEQQKMLSAPQIKKIRQTLQAVEKSNPKPALNHGDIRLKNMIVSEEGEIQAVLDWEHAVSNAAPEWELSLALHDLTIDEKQEFLEGYGISDKKFREIAPVVRAINIVNYAPEIERLANDKNAVKLDQYRTRLSGALDLYSV